MSYWRGRLCRILPDKRFEIEHRKVTLDAAFTLILPRCLEAHRRGDGDELKRFYGFAQWCYRADNAPQLRSAAEWFYQHLADHEEARREMHLWLNPSIFRGLSERVRGRVTPQEFEAIARRFGDEPF